jgi:hypothetical protein
VKVEEKVLQKVAAKWLALLLHIREVPDSNLGRKTGSTNYGFLCYVLIPLDKFLGSNLI